MLLSGAIVCIALLLILSAAAGAGGRGLAPLVYPSTMLLALALLACQITGLAADSATLHLPFGLPGSEVRLRLDPLSAFFGVIVDLGAALSSLYAIGYGRKEPDRQRILPFFPAFIASMNLVLLADDAFTFLVAWEFMSLTSWALVLAHHRNHDNRHAGYVYLLMANAGTIALLFAFGALAGPGGAYGFDEIRGLSRPGWMQGLALAMTLVGAGSKAGLVPLHVWLPLAHPAAPSPVSALMSGAMTKVALYGLIRILFDLSGASGWWWSVPLLLAGSATALFGIVVAVLQQDVKKLLAYSTVENIGVITVAIGLALAFKACHMPLAAAVAMTAALLHAFNHSLFKNLLFLGSGAILHATGQFDLDRLGGLIHRMPVTAWLFLAGCASAAALPPLNGFVSEWLLFQAILVSPDIPQALLRFIIPAVGALLALAAALAATGFVKLFGIAFLGRPRSPEAAQAHETDGFSLAAMAALAGLCLASGLFASPLAESLVPITAHLVGGVLPEQGAGPAVLSLTPFTSTQSSYNAPILLFFMTASSILTGWFIHLLASRRIRRAPAWDCGFPDPSSATQHSASGISQPIRRIFGGMLMHARESVAMPPPGDLSAASLRVEQSDPMWERFYAPLSGRVWWLADRLNVLQFLTIRRYLALTFSALILLLIVVALWQG
jgi:hydrogenase-4 component B